MSIGKHISLEEARKQQLLERFANAHPSEADKRKFDQLLDRMAKKKPKGGKT